MLQKVATPGSLSEAQGFLSSLEGAALIAGGTLVMPVLNHGTDAVTNLVSLRKAGLSGMTIESGQAKIGAAATLTELEEERALAFLRPALATIASPTIRNMATVGGNLFAKQPYGDLAACLIALGATATIAGPDGERVEAVEKTVAGIGQGEIVTHISFALPAENTFFFRKATRKAFNSGAIVTVAAVVAQQGGLVSECRIALGGVAKTAVRAPCVEKALIGRPLDRASVEQAAREARGDIDPADDAYASAWYRARVTPVHIRRALIGE